MAGADATTPLPQAEPTTRPEDRTPVVVIDDVHLVYRVAGRRSRATAPPALYRMLRREQPAGTREIHAVQGVSLVAYRGEAVGLIGPNGSGKSTLLRGIAGLMAPAAGAFSTRGAR